MNWWIPIAVLAVLLLLRWRKAPPLAWFVAWTVGVFVVLRFGFTTPIPSSVIKIYTAIAVAAQAIYFSADADRFRALRQPLFAFLTERRWRVPLALSVVAVPALAMLSIYRGMTLPPTAPNFGRTVHPAPPQEITALDREYDLTRLDNPYRRLASSDPTAFAAHVASGRRLYYQNCFYCHGDVMQGDGLFAYGLNPIPTNFQDAGTIAQLQEGFLFWRIAKGGPGLPSEGGPWDSAMPVWEKFLTEDEIWDVIAFLYDFTGYQPRSLHAAAAGGEGHDG